MASKVSIYDTTLRDGAQSEGVSFSIDDKLDILRTLDGFGIDFVEGGWPSANPKDDLFFKRASALDLETTRLVAFGSTRRSGVAPGDDANIAGILGCGAEWACIFGKSWDLHVRRALQVSLDENLEMVRSSVEHLVSEGIRVIFDAEHFFDGYRNDRDHAMDVVRTAVDAGAEWVCLCDTNGGSLPSQVHDAVMEVVREIDVPVGVHAHNDSELAVANSLVAVEAGALMVQGTINGIGERTGNANLCSIIPDLELKMGRRTSVRDIGRLTYISNLVGEVANTAPDPRRPFVGRSAFAHKGGIHVSAMSKDSQTYEHIDPAAVGNVRRILVSEQAGTTSVLSKLTEFGMEVGREDGQTVLNRVKELESEGFHYEGAEASLELLVRRLINGHIPQFDLGGFSIFVNSTGDSITSEASVKVHDPFGNLEHTASMGDGPVNALDRALRKALERFYPEIRDVRLVDFKVRVIDERDATAAKVRVHIRSTDGRRTWTTVGVSSDIIEASLMALVDSLEYILMKSREDRDRRIV